MNIPMFRSLKCRRFICLVLTAVLLTGLFSINVFAAEPEIAQIEFAELIEFAQRRLENSAEPSPNRTYGRHPTSVRSNFFETINSARTLLETPGTTDSQILAATLQLERDIDTFMQSMIDPRNRYVPYWREIAHGEDNIQARHMRGVWIATVSNIDWPSVRGTTPTIVEQQITQLVQRFDEIYEAGFNAVMFQVSPTGDAFFPSEIVPWSPWLTGETNFTGELRRANGDLWDPLQMAIELARERNLEFHAWFNPYRITQSPAGYNNIRMSSTGQFPPIGGQFEALMADGLTRPNSPWSLFPGDVRIADLDAGGRFILNHAVPEARDWITARVMEVVNNYDIDAIQFDDYFIASGFYDADSFLIYNTPEFNRITRSIHTNINDWRRESTEIMVRDVADAIKASRPYIRFGISPGGIWRSRAAGETGLPGGGFNNNTGSASTSTFTNFDSSFVDTRRWVIENFIDYIAPQIYWGWGYSVGEESAPFGPIADWWARLVRDYGPGGTMLNSQGGHSYTHLYLGLGPYRIRTNPDRPCWSNAVGFDNEGIRNYLRQEHYSLGNPHVRGSMVFTQLDIRPTAPNSLPLIWETLGQNAWRYPALVPAFDHLGGVAPRHPVNITASGNTIFWTDAESSSSPLVRSHYFVIYASNQAADIKNPANIVAIVPAVVGQMSYSHTINRSTESLYIQVTAVNHLHQESCPETIFVTDSNSPVFDTFSANNIALGETSVAVQGPTLTFDTAIESQTNGIRDIIAVFNVGGNLIDVSDAIRRSGEDVLLRPQITLIHRFEPEVILTGLPVSLTITAIDGNNLQRSQTVYFTVEMPDAPVISTEVLPPVMFNTVYHAEFRATSEVNVYWTILGNLPAGLEFSSISNRGFITGTPAQFGTFPLIVRAANNYGGVDERLFTLVLEEPPRLQITTDYQLPNGGLNANYRAILRTNSICSGGVTWTIAVGSLPDGLVLNLDGTISGRPETTGIFEFTAHAVDSGGSATRQFSVIIRQEIVSSEPNALRIFDFESDQPGFVNTNWGAGNGLLNNSLSVTCTTYAGMGALSWQISDIGDTTASSISSATAMTLPQINGQTPIGIGFWINIYSGDLNAYIADAPLRLGLINGGQYMWWEVPINRGLLNQWQWVEVDFAGDLARNAVNAPLTWDPAALTTIPGPGTGIANAFLWLRKLGTLDVNAEVLIDNITLLYEGLSVTLGANFDSKPPMVQIIQPSIYADVVVLLEDPEEAPGTPGSGLNIGMTTATLNNIELPLSFSYAALSATLTIPAASLNPGENKISVTVWDNFGFVTKFEGIVLGAEVSNPSVRGTLDIAISYAENLSQNDYTIASWTQLQNELSVARRIAENVRATQAQINTARDRLNAAIDALDPKPVVVSPPAVDKSALLVAIAYAENLAQSDYTVASWTQLQNELTIARRVAENTRATQAQVDMAFERLITIKNALALQS